jgi:hypothetical protein
MIKKPEEIKETRYKRRNMGEQRKQEQDFNCKEK